jgi:hypothetical protein
MPPQKTNAHHHHTVLFLQGLVWQYAEVTGYERWKWLTWGMLPSLGSAMAACTWHFFYNSSELEFLVVLQAGGRDSGLCHLAGGRDNGLCH